MDVLITDYLHDARIYTDAARTSNLAMSFENISNAVQCMRYALRLQTERVDVKLSALHGTTYDYQVAA